MSALFDKKSHIFMYGIFIMGILIVFDHVIKYVVTNDPGTVYMCNTGIAMGIEIHVAFFITLWTVIVMLLAALWWAKRMEPWSIQLPFIMIFSGAIGNMIDRIVYGCVIDYIPLLNISSFNFADALISCGALLLLFHNRKSRRAH